MIDGKQRGIDRHKIDVLNEMERPKTGKAMESFLGFVNFLRDYVPNFALIAGPLEKLRKVKRIGEKEWTDEVQGAWDKLKAVLKKAPVLSAPDYSLPFRVATDASQYGIGAVLYQVKEGKNHYIHFSRQQNPSSFYFWDSYLRITIQKSIHESHNFPNDPIIKS